MRVEVFSLGFGKRLFGFKRGGTDYRVSALPFGGYVKMSGENPMEAGSGDPAEFTSHPRWQRLIIALAGPVMNGFFAVAMFTGLYMFRYEHPAFLDRAAIISEVPPNTPGSSIGLVPGDRIVRVDGKDTPTWGSVITRMAVDTMQIAQLTVRRGDQTIEKSVSYDQPKLNPFDFLGVEPDQPYIIGRISEGLPAAKAGLQIGDEILSVNGHAVHRTAELLRIIEGTKDKPIAVELKRKGILLRITLNPEFVQLPEGNGYRIGVSEPSGVHQLPFTQALRASLDTNRQYSTLVFEVLGRLLTRKTSIRQMSGPIDIAHQSGDALRGAIFGGEGPFFFLGLMAIISLQLGIFNLLPIPILDGGLILLIVIEGVMRRDIKREIKELVYQAAFVFLVLFAVIVIYNDLTKTALGHFLP